VPHYMIQFAYSHEAWAALVKTPQNRTAALEEIARSLGGRVVTLYYHFGEYDGFAILEVDNDTLAGAGVMAAAATGALRATRTTRLFSPKEMEEALAQAGRVTYRPPGPS
jgi:uncharacterized protein with GYD domain